MTEARRMLPANAFCLVMIRREARSSVNENGTSHRRARPSSSMPFPSFAPPVWSYRASALYVSGARKIPRMMEVK